MYGYISEHHGYGMTREQSGDYAEDLAASMLASTLGIEFDPDAAWNERKRVYETSNLIIGSTSITAYAEGDAERPLDLRRGCGGVPLYVRRFAPIDRLSGEALLRAARHRLQTEPCATGLAEGATAVVRAI